MQPAVPSADTWQQMPPNQLENQNFVSSQDLSSQNNFEQSTAASIQGINNNSNAAIDTTLQSWENGSLAITEPRELSWAYSSPQYYNPTQNLGTDFTPTSVSPNVQWNHNSQSKSNSETSKLSQPSLINDNVTDGADNKAEQQICSSDESKNNAASYCAVSSGESENNGKDLVVDADFGNSSLSAFFQNSDHNSANSECGETSTPIGKNIDTASLEETLSQLVINENEMSSVPTEDEQDEQNLEDTDDGGNQEVNFIQEEVNCAYEKASVFPAVFPEGNII